MERRYRYPQSQGTRGKLSRIGQAIKFLIGWNIVGYLIWEAFKKHTRQKDPKGPEYFDTRPSYQKLYMMKGLRPDAQLKISPSGFEIERFNDENTFETNEHISRGHKKTNENTEAVDKTVLVENEKGHLKNPAYSSSLTNKSTSSVDSTSSLSQSKSSYSLGSLFSLSWFRKTDES